MTECRSFTEASSLSFFFPALRRFPLPIQVCVPTTDVSNPQTLPDAYSSSPSSSSSCSSPSIRSCLLRINYCGPLLEWRVLWEPGYGVDFFFESPDASASSSSAASSAASSGAASMNSATGSVSLEHATSRGSIVYESEQQFAQASPLVNEALRKWDDRHADALLECVTALTACLQRHHTQRFAVHPSHRVRFEHQMARSVPGAVFRVLPLVLHISAPLLLLPSTTSSFASSASSSPHSSSSCSLPVPSSSDTSSFSTSSSSSSSSSQVLPTELTSRIYRNAPRLVLSFPTRCRCACALGVENPECQSSDHLYLVDRKPTLSVDYCQSVLAPLLEPDLLRYLQTQQQEGTCFVELFDLARTRCEHEAVSFQSRATVLRRLSARCGAQLLELDERTYLHVDLLLPEVVPGGCSAHIRLDRQFLLSAPTSPRVLIQACAVYNVHAQRVQVDGVVPLSSPPPPPAAHSHTDGSDWIVDAIAQHLMSILLPELREELAQYVV